MNQRVLILFCLCCLFVFVPEVAFAQIESVQEELRNGPGPDVIRTVVVLTTLAIVPALFIAMTSFIRIAIVLSMVRHAFGMPQTPPNPVLISLAFF